MSESSIAIADQINVVLVGAGVRPACLLEELEGADISHILSRYPDLKASKLDRGTIVSRRAFRASNIRGDYDLGEILGFPCASEFEELEADKDADRYGLSLHAVFRSGEDLQFYAYVCKDTRTLPALEAQAAAAFAALRGDPLFATEVVRVYAATQKFVSMTNLIRRIQLNTPIRSEERRDLSWQISNALANGGFSRLEFEDFHIESPRDRGILLAILSFIRSEPFEHGSVDDMQRFIRQWEEDVINMLRTTRGGAAKRKSRRASRTD
jgi:hypothetical protein